MLQFIARKNDRYSIAEMTRLAIEGGCRWIQLSMPDASDEEVRAVASEIIPTCRESGIFLLMEDRPGLAKDLNLHGIHLTNGCGIDPARLRDDLGPEAIIGIESDNAARIIELRGIDIDYISLPAGIGLASIEKITTAVKDAGLEIPIVASGDIPADDAGMYIQAGASGIATCLPIITAEDPVAATEATIAMLDNAKGTAR